MTNKLTGLSDSPTGVTENAGQCEHCGATARVGEGFCVNCLLREGLEAEAQASPEVFESVLAEANVPDKQWLLGNYEILEEIGRGGMGVIYRARQRHSRRIVAVKRVLAHQADSHETLARFRREAEAAAKLDHPNILPIFEVGESADGLPFFSMKYATGGSLRAAAPALRAQPNECARLLAKVARAIEYAHSQGILHRDLQPGNILLDGRGEPCVSDFGLAKWLTANSDLTQSLTTFGTPGYIAPEQAESAAGELTPAADVYSLGAILFNLLANRPPFIGANVLSVIRQAAANPAPKLRSLTRGLDRDLETICARCLERDPKARYQSAGDLAEDLERWLEGRPILARPVHAPARIWRWSRRNPVLASAAAACLLLASAVIWLLREQVASAPESPPPEKSIAVLPFENLGNNKDNSDFGAGIQDDVLTSLAQIRDLKVISRTSVMAYQKPGERNMREIGRALGVANVLEGTVRREGDRVLVNVQLIDARNDRHLWAERYDRTVADAIGLQGELATQIAVALKATLAPEEKARLDAGPTTNSEAYVLYLTALGKEATDEIAAEQLYVQATTLDPKFALADARASLLNSEIANYQQSLARKAKARAQAEEALRLSPTLGEAHMALGLCLYLAEKKYDAALHEFEIAAAASPNNALIYTYIGGIYRREGRWREAVASFERALSLDPRNLHIAFRAANNDLFVRHWPRAIAGFNRVLKIAPDCDAKIALAYLEVFQNNNPAAGWNILQNLPPDVVTEARWDLAMLERDYASAEKILSNYRGEKLLKGPKTFYQGRTALARGDIKSAQRHFAAAMPAFEGRVREDPNNPERHAELGLLYAYMQRKEDAIRESRRAVELEPESQNAFHGALWASNLAVVYVLVGEQDHAITLIERLLSTPGAASYPDAPNSITLAELRLRWEWDSLRSNPRFQKILAAPEPKTILTNATKAAPVVPEKSIAVLPFENLSDDKADSYFAAGVQDEILTDLARVADLKVTSRTSARFYEAGQARNSREIGQQLGVAHLLEGSVQRAGNRLRIHAQLIDARTDSHLWAQTYDRQVADLFALQSEIAQTIADQLQAKISAGEKAAIAQPVTTDLLANDLYLQAVALEAQPPRRDNLPKAISLLAQAVGRDPHFLRAYCTLARMHLNLYYDGYDRTAARLAMARAAIEKAAQLQPGASEVHLAWAHYYLGFGVRDYDRAREELELARRTLPNDSTVFRGTGLVDRRQGRWTEALRNFERAVELDPRNEDVLDDLANTYHAMRRYPEAAQVCRRALVLSPRDYWARMSLAYLPLDERADIRPLRTELNTILAEDPDNVPPIASDLWYCALLEHDATAADQALAAFPPKGMADSPELVRPREWYVGYNARTFNRPETARAAFTATRTILEKLVREQTDNATAWSLLGRVEAALGRKEEAIKAGRCACELLPLSREPVNGLAPLFDLAKIYAWVGEKDLALQLLNAHAAQVDGPSYGELKLDPDWDPLRGDPRFEKIVASLAPK